MIARRVLRWVVMMWVMMGATACIHAYDYEPPEQVNQVAQSQSHVRITEPLILTYKQDKFDVNLYDVFQESQHFETLYRDADRRHKFLTLIVRVDEENVSGTGQTLSALPGILTLGVAPISMTKDYTLNVAVYKGDKFLKRYRQTANVQEGVVLWNVYKADEKVMIKKLVSQFAGRLQADMAALQKR